MPSRSTFDAPAQWAVNAPERKVVWSRYKAGDMSVLRIGTEDQPILGKAGVIVDTDIESGKKWGDVDAWPISHHESTTSQPPVWHRVS